MDHPICLRALVVFWGTCFCWQHQGGWFSVSSSKNHMFFFRSWALPGLGGGYMWLLTIKFWDAQSTQCFVVNVLFCMACFGSVPRFDRIILEPAFWLVRKWGIQLNTTHFWMCSHNVHRNSFRGNPELYQWHEAGELVWKFQLHFLLNRCNESLGLGPRRF